MNEWANETWKHYFENPPRPLPTDRPATRVGRHLLFPGGRVVRVSRWEQLLFAIGLKTSTTTEGRSL